MLSYFHSCFVSAYEVLFARLFLRERKIHLNWAFPEKKKKESLVIFLFTFSILWPHLYLISACTHHNFMLVLVLSPSSSFLSLFLSLVLLLLPILSYLSHYHYLFRNPHPLSFLIPVSSSNLIRPSD